MFFLLLICLLFTHATKVDLHEDMLTVVIDKTLYIFYYVENQWVEREKYQMSYVTIKDVAVSSPNVVVLYERNDFQHVIKIFGENIHEMLFVQPCNQLKMFNNTLVTDGANVEKQVRVLNVYDVNGGYLSTTLTPSLNPENTCDGDIDVNADWIVTSCYNDLDYWVVVFGKINNEWVHYNIIRHFVKIKTLKLKSNTVTVIDVHNKVSSYRLV